MEIPDKIYVSTNINGEVFDNSWFWHNLHHSDVEYIRTDAFIDKAIKWLTQNIEHYVSVDEEMDCSEIDLSIYKDFRKAMKL